MRSRHSPNTGSQLPRSAARSEGIRKLPFATGLLAAITAGAALAAPTELVSAAWIQPEYTHAELGTLDCTADGLFATRGTGRLLNGGLLGLELESIVAVGGVTTTNNSSRSIAGPGSSTPALPSPHSYSNPLSVGALSLITVDLGPGGIVPLTSILQLPLNNDTGVLSQYSNAESDGTSIGASGYVSDNGDVGLGGPQGYPELGSLQLKALLESITGSSLSTLVTGIADLRLELGALSGRASLDSCAPLFGSSIDDSLARDYMVADLDLVVQSELLGDAVTSVNDYLQDLTSELTAITNGTSAILTTLTNGLLGTVISAVNALPLSLVGVQAGIDDIQITLGPLDTSALTGPNGLLVASFSDPQGLLTVHPASSEIRVDLAALLAEAYPAQYSHSLNGLEPNTELLLDAHVINTLTTALFTALSGWLGNVENLIDQALELVTINGHIGLTVQSEVCVLVCLTTNILGIGIDIADTTLGDLANGTGSVDVTIDVLGLGALLNPLVGGLVTTLESTLGILIGQTILDGLQQFPLDINAVVTGIVSSLSGLLGFLFGTEGVLSLMVNAQNIGSGASYAGPPEWQSTPQGQYRVAALRVGVLDLLGAARVRLAIAEGNVGVNCLLAGAPISSTACASY